MVRLSLAILCAAVCGSIVAAEPESFARTTIDLGTVVADLDKSARFYTEAIGFRQESGFEVGADVAAAAGLTDSKPLSIRVLVLGEGPSATKLKLMQVAGTAPRTGDNEFINSHTGFRYLTIFVHDTDAALSRLAKLGIKPMAKSPVALPESLGAGLFLTCVRDPDGNVVELVGPRR
ncbi:MAG: VOC family protein [Planctomycetia bacterium]